MRVFIGTLLRLFVVSLLLTAALSDSGSSFAPWAMGFTVLLAGISIPLQLMVLVGRIQLDPPTLPSSD